MGIVDRTRAQMKRGRGISYMGFPHDGFQLKLNEMKRELPQLQLTLHQLEMTHRLNSGRGSQGDGGTRHSVTPKIEAEIITLHGWIISLVESMFVLVDLEFGTKEHYNLRQAWRDVLLGPSTGD